MPVHPVSMLIATLRSLYAKAVQPLVDKAKRLAAAEPAVLIGAGLSLLATVEQALQGAQTWKQAVPILTALVIRSFVTAPDTLEAIKQVAGDEAVADTLKLMKKLDTYAPRPDGQDAP